jgi:MFS family permease
MTVPLLVALVLPYGAGQAIFGPAFSSIIPMIVPEEQLVEANSIGQTMRPLAMIVIGPIVGAAVVAVASTGWAFLLDAAHVRGLGHLHRDDARARRAQDGRGAPRLWADVREGSPTCGRRRG